MQSLPTEKFKRNVVRDKLDLVGKLIFKKHVLKICYVDFFFLFSQYPLVEH